ncbi:MAG: hypothetical protein R3B99_22310 [Polyangiales bacterium]
MLKRTASAEERERSQQPPEDKTKKAHIALDTSYGLGNIRAPDGPTGQSDLTEQRSDLEN